MTRNENYIQTQGQISWSQPLIPGSGHRPQIQSYVMDYRY